MSNTLSLATRLQAMSEVELAAAIRSRSVSPNGIKDFFDLAETLLSPASVQQTLTRLDRETLAVLAAIAELSAESAPVTAAEIAAELATLAGPDTLAVPVSEAVISQRATIARELLLLEPSSEHLSVYDTVRSQLRSWPAFGLPSLQKLALVDAPAALERVPDIDRRFIDRLGAERAFAVTSAITQLLAEVEREPARELAKGGVALPDTKRLANAMAVDLASVPVHIAVAEYAHLIAHESGSWMISDLGATWLNRSTGERWGELATAWFQRLPTDIRTLLGERTHALWGQGLRGYIDWLYPAGGDWMDERIAEYTRDAELLGITANQAPTGPGSLLLASGASHSVAPASGVSEATAAMTAMLPPEVEQVYLQHDLSIVAPGPLTPRVDSRLRTIADVESRALASSYRVSTSSVNRAMASGETEQSMLEFLRSITLTGIPQPLAYLIAEASARYGQIRVGSLEGARSYIRSDDALQIGTILVDQSLAPLSLERADDGRAISRFGIDVVFWSVSDARYPVAAEDANGEIVALRRQRTAKTAAPGNVDPIAALIERLRLGGSQQEEETSQAWLVRQLDIAIKARAALTVSVLMPNGSVVAYQLEPTSVAGGRLRGRDNRSAIERTLPLSRIESIGPAV